jgi:23S rRNA pseudoU1915 N3-methylase RlmH
LGARKEDKMAQLQNKLKQRMKTEQMEKAGQAIKSISTAQALRIENKGKMMMLGPNGASTSAAAAKSGNFSLSSIKQQSKAFVKATWSAR